jgi:hypothetical protein
VVGRCFDAFHAQRGSKTSPFLKILRTTEHDPHPLMKAILGHLDRSTRVQVCLTPRGLQINCKTSAKSASHLVKIGKDPTIKGSSSGSFRRFECWFTLVLLPWVAADLFVVLNYGVLLLPLLLCCLLLACLCLSHQFPEAMKKSLSFSCCVFKSHCYTIYGITANGLHCISALLCLPARMGLYRFKRTLRGCHWQISIFWSS